MFLRYRTDLAKPLIFMSKHRPPPLKSSHFRDFLAYHMAAPNGFGSKQIRKNDQNFPNFFFRKKEYKRV